MKYIGIMTGNSLDAVDIVLSEISADNIYDIAAYSQSYPEELTQRILTLRQKVKAMKGNVRILEQESEFISTIHDYTSFVGGAVKNFLAGIGSQQHDIKAIGFHGQTLDHFPPSIAGGEQPYTLQVGDACLLADMTDLPVVYDFRSDDIFNGGEGAPLAPLHNQHLALQMIKNEASSVAFCNAGNTGNIAIVSKMGRQVNTCGWDVGPFNHFSDMITRKIFNRACDWDGDLGKRGSVQEEIIDILYQKSARTNTSKNFYELEPPKSSDPSWYNFPQELEKFEPLDVLRSIEYFSAYNFVLSLRFIKSNLPFPAKFVLFGGGWNNPVCLGDFKNILQNRCFETLLPRHKHIFEVVFSHMPAKIEVEASDKIGWSGKYMEARIFADAARCYFEKIPFALPQVTGCKTPTICGACVYPGQKASNTLWSRAAKF